MVAILSICLAITLGSVTYLLLGQLLPSLIIVLISYLGGRYTLLKIYDKDALFIRDSLKLARKKTLQIQQYGRKLRMWRLWLKIRQIRKLNNEIIFNIHKHADRFPKADKFFSLYLDSTLNVLQKYDVLVNQPVRSYEMQESLRNTENMLDDIVKGLEQQLSSILEADLIDLEIEREVLDKHTPK